MELIPKKYSTYLRTKPRDDKSLLFYHGYIAITNYNLGDNEKFEKAVSVWDEIFFTYRMIGAYYVPVLQELRVNRGFDPSILMRYFPKHTPKLVNEPTPTQEVAYDLWAGPRDEIQRVALTFMASEGPYENNKKYTQQIIACDTGDGKTYCGVATSAYLSARVLVIVPFSKLIEQWADSFTKFTSLKRSQIMVVQGGTTCDKILAGKTSDIVVYIAMVDTLQSYHKRHGDMVMVDLLRATGAQVKIVDEMHRNMKAICMIDALSNFKRNYYMSASPGRTDKQEQKVFDRIYHGVPRFGEDFKVQDEKHLNIFVKRYSFIPDNKQMGNFLVGRKRWMNAKLYEKELINAPDFQRKDFDDSLDKVLSSIRRRKADECKVLILCESVDGTDYFRKRASQFFGEENVSRYYGGMKASEKTEALTYDVICSTSQSLGTGADIKDVQFVVNMGTYSSNISAVQLPGRARKLDGHDVAYIEMVNFGYKKTVTQFNERKKTLVKKSRSGSITMID